MLPSTLPECAARRVTGPCWRVRRGPAVRFRVLHPRLPQDLRTQEGLLFTGTLGRRFPAGLSVSDRFVLRGQELGIQDFRLRRWPSQVEVVDREAVR